MGTLIGNRFMLGRKVGSSSAGDVYIGTDVQSGEEIAIKTESIKTKQPRLMHESVLYKLIGSNAGMPAVHWYGVVGDNNVVVMDLLGPSLEHLLESCDRKFGLKTVLLLADQIIHLVEHVHSNGFVHCDIKPKNFLMGLGKMANKVHIINLGSAHRFWDSATGQHIPQRPKTMYTEDPEYASVQAHKEIAWSRRDDLESVGYMLMYFMNGRLPWQGLDGASVENQNGMHFLMKGTSPTKHPSSRIPGELGRYVENCRSLRFYEKPDYDTIRKTFKGMLIHEGYVNDFAFDWKSIVLKGTGDERETSEPSRKRRRFELSIACGATSSLVGMLGYTDISMGLLAAQAALQVSCIFASRR